VLNKNHFLLIGILLLGLFLRLYGNSWDQGFHLHPDERFLTMVGNDVKIPQSFSEYINPQTSSFNPANKGHAFYVYGTFPLLINKILAIFLYNNTYDMFNLQGRTLSGIADMLVLLLIYKICVLFEKKLKFHSSIKLYATFFYAIAVLPLQLSHFFAVDTFLNLFSWWSLYYAVRFIDYIDDIKHIKKFTILNFKFNIVYLASLSGLFFGLALACKVSTLYFLPFIGSILLVGGMQMIMGARSKLTKRPATWMLALTCIAGFVLFSYLALRLGSPYYFESKSFFSPQISTLFLNNIQTLKSFDNPLGYFPPAIQWLSKSPLYQLQNIFFFGVGPFYFIFSVIGLGIALLKRKNFTLFISIIWMILFMIYQSVQFAKSMRYLIFIYPLLALFAGVGLVYTLEGLKKIAPHCIYLFISLCIYLCIVIWPLAFFSIYTKDHSRVAASKWMFESIPAKSILLSEYWDDALPLPVENPIQKGYHIIEVHIFDLDSKEKWEAINIQLKAADYYVMSSNRGWGSLTTLPRQFPETTKFYNDMFNGIENYTLIKEFASYPSLRYLGIPLDFPDQWAEEAFTVYDHPLVKIFKKK